MLGWHKRRVTARGEDPRAARHRPAARRQRRDPGRRRRRAAGDPGRLAEAGRAGRRRDRRGRGGGQPARRATSRATRAGWCARCSRTGPATCSPRSSAARCTQDQVAELKLGKKTQRALRGGQEAARPAGPLRLRAAAGAARRGRGRPGARRRRAARARPHAGDPRPRRLPRARQGGGRAHRRGPARPRGRARDRAARAQAPPAPASASARRARRPTPSTARRRASSPAARTTSTSTSAPRCSTGSPPSTRRDMDVARFFAFGLLGPDTPNYLGTGDHVARTIAANGIRLVLDEHRTTETPTLKSGQPGQDEGHLRRARGRPEVAVEVRRMPSRGLCRVGARRPASCLLSSGSGAGRLGIILGGSGRGSFV